MGKTLQCGVKGEAIEERIYAVQDFDQFTSSKQETVKKRLGQVTRKKKRNF